MERKNRLLDSESKKGRKIEKLLIRNILISQFYGRLDIVLVDYFQWGFDLYTVIDQCYLHNYFSMKLCKIQWPCILPFLQQQCIKSSTETVGFTPLSDQKTFHYRVHLASGEACYFLFLVFFNFTSVA